jgi:hypothetical protein
MSILNEYRSTEAAIAELAKKLEAMRPTVQQELDQEKELKEFVEALGLTNRKAALLLHPDFEHKASSVAGNDQGVKHRRERVVKVYQNPHTGEIIETKGGNHKGLKDWKSQYSSDTVESWLRK